MPKIRADQLRVDRGPPAVSAGAGDGFRPAGLPARRSVNPEGRPPKQARR